MRSGRRAPGFVAVLLALIGGAAAGCAATPGPGGPSPTVVPPSSVAQPSAAASTASTASTASAASGPSPRPTTTGAAAPTASGPTVAGFDVSRYNANVDWRGLAASGHRFVYVKATEGTSHTSPTHAAQRTAARAAGLYQGAYHYARPAASDGATQARFFTAHGGAWSPDGRTVPGALDLEQSTAGARCHGLTVAAMRLWVRDFVATYADLNARAPVVYVKAEVWRECLGDARDAGGADLWLFDHDGDPAPLPAAWTRPTLWQRGVEAGLDRNVFFGSEADLARWASGS